MSDIVSVGRRVAVGLAGWFGGQEQALDNARRASTEVSRHRVEREAVSIYLDQLHTVETGEVSAEEWQGRRAQAAD